GGDLMLEAVRRLPVGLRAATTVMLMGGLGGPMQAALTAAGCRVAEFGYIASDRLKAVLYSAADVFVFPTRADNSPLVTLESLACGTPVVSFDVGGVAEVVRPGQTGLLAPPEDTGALAVNLARILEDHALRGVLGRQGREMVIAEYPDALAARRHVELYRRLVVQAGSQP
nr:glycosyltransferase [Actinomycetota bacterium]